MYNSPVSGSYTVINISSSCCYTAIYAVTVYGSFSNAWCMLCMRGIWYSNYSLVETPRRRNTRNKMIMMMVLDHMSRDARRERPSALSCSRYTVAACPHWSYSIDL